MKEIESIFNELESMQGVQIATADRLKHEAEERKKAAEDTATRYNKAVLDESVPVSVLAEYRVAADRAAAFSEKAQAEYEHFIATPGCIDTAAYRKSFKEIQGYYQNAADTVYKHVNKVLEGLKKDCTDLEQIHNDYMQAVRKLNAIVRGTHSACNMVDTGNIFGRTDTEIKNEMYVRQCISEFAAKLADRIDEK